MRGTLIAGLQKTTTIDFPGKLACTVFTRGCNFRCPYCHNSTLVLDEKNKDDISKDEFIAFLKKRKGVLDGVCISGGEPLMHENLIDLIIKIKEMGYLVKLDTNGSFPKKLRDLISKGLIDYVAMDIKNSPENYVKAIGLNYVDIKNINARIEPGAIIRDKVIIGDKAVIMMGAVINIGAEIGEGTMIDMNVVLGGRAKVGKNCHIGAGSVLAGVIEPPSADPVIIEDGVVIGANAVVLEGVKVGKGSVVAAGAVVTENVPENVVVAGMPAKIIKNVDDRTSSKTKIVEDLRK